MPTNYGLPCAWQYDPDHNITLRWGRPDGYYTVHHGDQRGQRANTGVLETVRVGTSWINEHDLARALRDWTRTHPCLPPRGHRP